MSAELLAFSAAVAGVAGAWDCLAGLEADRSSRRLLALLAPVRRARDEGRLPDAAERRRLAILSAGSLLAAGWIAAGPLLGAALGAVGPLVAAGAVRAGRRRYVASVRRGAAPAARAMAGALGAGRSIRAAVVEAANTVDGPAGRELRIAARALALGEPTDVVLERLREQAGGGPWDTLAAALALQRDAGGDLAGLLRDLAGSLEAVTRAAEEARTATAQARATARIVAVLPFLAASLTEIAQPGFVASLSGHPLSVALALGAAGLQLTALVLIRRIAP